MNTKTETKDVDTKSTQLSGAGALSGGAVPATQQAQSPGSTALPMVIDYGADAGKGLEDISFDEISIPFIQIIQSNSPQVDPTEAKYIPDAKPGMLLITSTNEVFDGLTVGMDFIPCHRDKNYVEYTPRDSGGGFVGIHAINDPRILQLKAKQGGFKKLKTPNNTELTETKYIYGLFILGEDYVIPAVLGFASTQIKRYTGFMDVISKIKYPTPDGTMVRPPMWAHRWHLSVVPDSNKKGKFFSRHVCLVNGAKLPKPIAARLDRSKPADDELYQRASELYESIKAGRATAAYDTGAPAEGDTDDIPF